MNDKTMIQSDKTAKAGGVKVRVRKLDPAASLPKFATAGSACFDLVALDVNGDTDRSHPIRHGSTVQCGTGLAFEIPPGHVMLVFSRSGQGFNHGIRLANCVGVIDSDYRGEVKVKLTCDKPDESNRMPYDVRPGERVAQALILPVPAVELDLADELSTTQRGAAGFGSTGSASF